MVLNPRVPFSSFASGLFRNTKNVEFPTLLEPDILLSIFSQTNGSFFETFQSQSSTQSKPRDSLLLVFVPESSPLTSATSHPCRLGIIRNAHLSVFTGPSIDPEPFHEGSLNSLTPGKRIQRGIKSSSCLPRFFLRDISQHKIPAFHRRRRHIF